MISIEHLLDIYNDLGSIPSISKMCASRVHMHTHIHNLYSLEEMKNIFLYPLIPCLHSGRFFGDGVGVGGGGGGVICLLWLGHKCSLKIHNDFGLGGE